MTPIEREIQDAEAGLWALGGLQPRFLEAIRAQAEKSQWSDAEYLEQLKRTLEKLTRDRAINVEAQRSPAPALPSPPTLNPTPNPAPISSLLTLEPVADVPDVPGVPPPLEGQPYDTALRTRPEATMETRPAAPLGLQREPTVSPELADAIAAVRGGYNPEVEAEEEENRVALARQRIADGTKRIGDESRPPVIPKSVSGSRVDNFVANMTALQAGKAKQALSKNIQSGGNLTTLAALVESRVANGATVEREEEVDTAARNKLQAEYNRTKGTHPFGNQNHPETIRFNKVKAELQAGGPKVTVRRLVNADGETFLSEKSIGKTAMDYAEHLLAKPNSPTPPDQSGGPTELTPPAKGTAEPLSPTEVSEFNALEQARRAGTLDAAGATRYRELETRAGQGDLLMPAPPPLTPANVPTAAKVTPAQASQAANPKTEFNAKVAKEQKKFLLDAVDKALAEAPDTSPQEIEALWRASEHFAAKQKLEDYTKANPYPTAPSRYNFGYTDEELAKYQAAQEEFQKAQQEWQARRDAELQAVAEPYLAEMIGGADVNAALTEGTELAFYRSLPHVTIEVPGDGVFSIINTKDAIREFKERAAKFPTTAARAKAPTQARTGPSPVPALGELTKENVLKAAALAMSTDPSRAIINTVWSDGQQTVATDGRRMHWFAKGIGGTVKKPAIVDAKGKPVTNLDRDYPNWQQVRPDKAEMEVVFTGQDAGKLWTVLKQAQQMTEERSNSVALWWNRDRTLGISSASPDAGTYEHNVQPKAKIMTALDPQYVMDALAAARGTGSERVDILWNDNMSPVVIQAPGFEAVIMPMRLSGPSPIFDPEMLTRYDLAATPETRRAMMKKDLAAIQRLRRPTGTEEVKAKWLKEQLGEVEDFAAEIARLEAKRKKEAAKPRTTAQKAAAQQRINAELQAEIDRLKALQNASSPSPSARRSGTSAVGDPMMPPIPPGVPGGTHSDARMPVAMERIVPGTVDVPTVMAALEDIVRAVGGESPIRAGRFNEEARGIFKTFSEVIRLRQSDNIPTAAHEVAHAVSKQIFGSSSSRALLAAVKSRPVVKELQALGKALYGSTKPAAGYTAEGLSELVRLWLTTENAAKAAPAATKWLASELFKTEPALAQAMQRARDLIDVWRGQGAMGRAQAQMKEPPGRIARLKKLVQEQLGPQSSVEAFEPLYDLSKGYEKVTGRKLAPSEDPYLLASAKRRVAGHIVSTMVHDSMLDIWGNPTGPSLKEGLARIKPERETDFAIYLWSRRAIERWAKGKNPGLALEDAQYLRNKLENPDFIEAARKWYQWWDGLLAYVEQAAPAVNGPLIAAIRAGSAEYVPLARVLDEALVKGTVSLSAGGGLQRMQGSGRPIKNIYQQSLLIAERLVERANRDLVLEAVFKLAQTEGMGWLIERVPRQRAMEQLNVEKIRRELESYGVDTSSIPEDTLVKFATHRERPTGVDPIMVRQGPDGPEWYQVPAAVFDALEGVETPARLGPVMDLLFAMPTRVLKMGTTGLRASFSLFTNPARDIPTFMAQSIAGNPASRAMAYFRALGDILKAGLTGKETEAWKTFHRLGISAGNFLGGDIQQARREAKALFRGRVFRRIASPVETLREALSFSEAAPRLAEMGMVGKEFGWEPGKPLTPDAAVAMSLAAKRVTTDFSAAGLKGQVWNQVMPFSNAVIQGTRSFFRAFKSDQDIKRVDKAWLRALLFGLSAFTLPIIWNWWRNKDQEWYRQLPWRERYLYTNVEGADGVVYQVPRPAEWGNLFMVLPEAFLDLWHTRDPEGVQQAIGHIFTSQNPIELPPLAKAAKEQYANRIDFWDRPIIPRGQIDLPPGAQRAEYSSELAKALGNAFPNQVSPRRVDAAIRALLGGVGADLADAPGALMKALGIQERTREPEPADMAIIGRLWRRGGQWSAQERSLMDFWDDYSRYTARARDWKSAMREGRQPAAPMSSRELGYAQALEAWKQVIRIELEIAGRTPDTLGRQSLYRSATQHAKQAVEMRPKN